MGQIVRSRSLWGAWVLLVVGMSAAGFDVLSPLFTSGFTGVAVTLGFPLILFLTVVYASTQRGVVGRSAAYLRYGVLWAFAGLFLVDLVYRFTVHPQHLSVTSVLLGISPALPCLYGAWTIVRP